MTDWEPKDPDEIDRFSVDWRPDIGEDAIASSTWNVLTSAGISTSAPQFDSRFTSILISGGTDGDLAVLENRIETADGRLLEVTKRLPIIASLGAGGSGYTAPSPAQMAVQMPAFASVPTEALRTALAEGAAKVSEDWKEADYRRGIMLYAAHSLTLDGHGAGTEASLAREGLGDFQSVRSGGLAVSRFERRGGTPTGLESTSYGKRFAHLQRLNFAGPRVIPGKLYLRCNHLATDCD